MNSGPIDSYRSFLVQTAAATNPSPMTEFGQCPLTRDMEPALQNSDPTDLQ